MALMTLSQHEVNVSFVGNYNGDLVIVSISQGEKLALIRDSERLTKQQLVDLVGLNYTTYHGYERDKSKNDS